MKKIITQLTLSILLLSNVSWAQNYQVSFAASTYTNISNPNLLDKTLYDYLGNNVKLFTAIPIGFSFVVNGIDYDSIRICENGFVLFEKAGQTEFGISIYDCDLKDFHDTSSFSPINYKMNGAIGNRIFKCEFINAGFFEDQQNDDFINFQLWIYESCNDFEVRIGPSSINSNVFFNGNSAPYVGYATFQPYTPIVLTGNPSSPVLTSVHNETMTSQPTEGSVYSFSMCPTHISSIPLSEVKTYPNPTTNSINLNLGTNHTYTHLAIIDINGRKIIEYQLQGQSELEVNLEKYNSGIYLLQLKSEQKIESIRIIKN